MYLYSMKAESQAKNRIVSDILSEMVVVELASVLAGPLAGSFLSELGATVVKIENRMSDGDVTRQWRLPNESADLPISAYYASANTGKSVLKLDLTSTEDYQILMQQISKADIVISNFQKVTAEKLKIDHQTIHALYPKVIYAQLSAYTYDDPRPGYDLVMQAEAGYISMTGTSKDQLSKMPVAMIDIMAGHQLKEVILLGVIHKMKTGKGSLLKVSLYKSAISGLVNQASNYLMQGHVAQPMGTLHPNIAPYGDIFSTKDGINVILAVGSDQQFAKLGKTLSLADELQHTFRSNKERVKHRQELTDVLQRQISKLIFRELSPQLTQKQIPFCRVSDMSTVFTDPIAIEMIIKEDLEGVKAEKVRNVAFDFTEVE